MVKPKMITFKLNSVHDAVLKNRVNPTQDPIINAQSGIKRSRNSKINNHKHKMSTILTNYDQRLRWKLGKHDQLDKDMINQIKTCDMKLKHHARSMTKQGDG